LGSEDKGGSDLRATLCFASFMKHYYYCLTKHLSNIRNEKLKNICNQTRIALAGK
jgi:hypothetical protein